MDDFSRYLEQQLQDPEFKEEWDSSKPEYELMRLLVLARSKNNMTQAELAKKTGIRQSNISRIENGKCSPNLETLIKLAKGLNKKIQIQII
jgi:DNA-binding XRE family transcriptional regulator